MQWFDHIITLWLVVVAPIWTARSYRTFVAAVQAGKPAARLAEYRESLLWGWGLCFVVMAWWFLAGRPFGMLGFQLPAGMRTVVGAALTVAALLFLLYQWRAVLRPEGMEAVRAQVAPVVDMMPHTRAEHAMFRWMSVTAGITEEVTYRGFLLWYLQHVMPDWTAAIAGGVMFGLAHWYQGTSGVIKTGVTGILMALLYAGTDSLLWPIILHTAVDLQGGAIGWRVVNSEPSTVNDQP